MRISRIYVTHFIGLKHAELQLRAPVQLLCGPNGAGKSSLRDGVALALTADLGRVSLKKDAPALIRDGADLAVAEVTCADGDQWRVTINRGGKVADSMKGRDPDPVLPYVLDAQRLARLAPTERRAFLFGLTGVKMAPADIAARLAAKGCDDARVQRVLPLLRSGFDAASEEAKRRATEAKGAWRTVTGEAYGPEKAKGWRATVPAFDAARLKALATDVGHADVAIGQWQEQIGKLQAEEHRRQSLRARLPALQEHGAKVPRLLSKIEIDRQALADAEHALQQAQQRAGAAPRVGLVHELACVLYAVAWDQRVTALVDVSAIHSALKAYEREYGPLGADAAGDPEALATLPALRDQAQLMQRAVANSERDLKAAEGAHAEATRIAAELDEAFDAAALLGAREQVDKLKAARAAAVAEADKLKSVKALVDAADAKTKQAVEHAADVAAWDQIAKALAPDGIPAEILDEAMGPINDRLAQSAADTGWPMVAIDRDMAITYGGRSYALCSESERWRADAMLAEAVANVSGTRLLVLDRMDVLDLPGRSDLLGWLSLLAESGELDTALVFATLKAAPVGLGDQAEAHWIEGGVVTTERLAQAA